MSCVRFKRIGLAGLLGAALAGGQAAAGGRLYPASSDYSAVALRRGYSPGPATLRQLALVIDKAEDPNVARIAYERASRIDPNDPTVRLALARRSARDAAPTPGEPQPYVPRNVNPATFDGGGVPPAVGTRPAAADVVRPGSPALTRNVRRLAGELKGLQKRLTRLQYSLAARLRYAGRRTWNSYYPYSYSSYRIWWCGYPGCARYGPCAYRPLGGCYRPAVIHRPRALPLGIYGFYGNGHWGLSGRGGYGAWRGAYGWGSCGVSICVGR